MVFWVWLYYSENGGDGGGGGLVAAALFSLGPSFLQVQTSPCVFSRYQVFSKMEQ